MKPRPLSPPAPVKGPEALTIPVLGPVTFNGSSSLAKSSSPGSAYPCAIRFSDLAKSLELRRHVCAAAIVTNSEANVNRVCNSAKI